MRNPSRPRAILAVNKNNIGAVTTRAQTMCNGIEADKVTYAAPQPPMAAFQILIQNLSTAQQLVKTRVAGATAARNVQRDLLFTAMGSELIYVQGLADASATPARAISIIQNAGLVVAQVPVHVKVPLALALGKQPGSVVCDANVSLLIGAGTAKPSQSRFFNWSYTLDGGKKDGRACGLRAHGSASCGVALACP
jgi:hypothetical protein